MTKSQSNISCLSRHTYSERLHNLINLIGNHPAEINKKYLKDFLVNLKSEEHYIYALIDNLPLELFSIERYHKHGEKPTYNWSLGKSPDLYSVKDFKANYDQFHEEDFFRVSFGQDHFYFELELSLGLFIPFYKRFLAYHCEKGLRTNNPIILTPQICKQYGLTCADARTVEYYITIYSKEIIERIQLEYEALNKLDSVKK